MTTPDDAGAQLEAIAAALSTLATAEKTRADAAATLATTQKTLADAQTVLLQNEAARAAAATTLEKTRLETDAQRLANDKAASDQRILEREKLTASVTGAVPDLSAVAKNTVTYADGAAIRGAEFTHAALARAAAHAASAIRTALTGVAEPTVLVTSTRSLIADIALRDQIAAETSYFAAELPAVTAELTVALNEVADALATTRDMPIDTRSLTPLDGALVVAAAAGATVDQLARLAEVEVSARLATSTVPALVVHGSVIAAILAPDDNAEPSDGVTRTDGVTSITSVMPKVRHESMALPSEASEIVAHLGALRGILATLAAERAQVPVLIAQLTSRVTGSAAEADGDTPRADTQAGEPDERARLESLRSALVGVDARAGSLADQLLAFSARITTPGADGRPPLAVALALEGLTAATAVLVIGDGTAETTQMTVARRIRMPRIHVSVGVGFEWFLVRADQIVAAGHAHGAVSTSARVRGGGLEWQPV
ncbi:hypothetical protein [Microbacterium invictum]|uniref:Uncharacterized protein n=1 Tax=Microbacterium invictum TaxID=515415 RepID=A0ABZ0V8B0_9MICO|nr:hypothetical protein [Microbacterium invictum]WQB69868.1 hypothetical protein T9R20_14380 [Microbacterium invictum]